MHLEVIGDGNWRRTEEERHNAGREKRREIGRCVKEGTAKGKGRVRKEQKVKGGVEVRFFVCVVVSVRCIVVHTTQYIHAQGRKERVG